MCDPIAATLIGVAASAATAYMNYSAQQEMMSNQARANAEWVSYQRQKSREESLRQEQARQQAENARQGTLSEVTAEKQKEAQTTEEQRLQKDITPQDVAVPELLQDQLMQGQGKSPLIASDLSERINQATKDARARIANLASISSYGGSQFGLQNRAQDLFNQSGQNIRLQGSIRQGSLGAYGVEKGVEPIRYAMGGGGGGNIAGALAGMAGKAGAQAFGGGGGGFTFDGAPVPASSVFVSQV